MRDEVEVKESVAEPSVEVHITEARPSGWLAWYRFGPTDYFNQVYDTPSLKLDRDYYRCPYPLFPTREDAVAAGRHAMRERGGELRLVQIRL